MSDSNTLTQQILKEITELQTKLTFLENQHKSIQQQLMAMSYSNSNISKSNDDDDVIQ